VDDALAPLAFDLPALCEPEKLLVEGQGPLKRADDKVEVVENWGDHERRA
jgi:hypothetical protein